MGLFSKKKKSVLEFLKEDLTKLDINSFEFINTETNAVGTEIKNYKKKIDGYELGLFDTMELILFPDGEKNIFYKGDFAKLNFLTLIKFVNELVSIYGKDNTGKGKMDNNELNNIGINNFWVGRTWDDVDLTVSIDAIDGDTINLSILGIM